MLDDSTPYIVEINDDAIDADVLDAVETSGGRVRHRYGKVVLLELSTASESALRSRLPSGARLLAAREIQRRPVPTGETIEAMGIAAQRLRQSQEFRRSKAQRRTEGEEWGSGDVLAPDADEEDEATDLMQQAHRPLGGQP